MTRQRELGRGERVLPGLWRLRLPLPWPGVPHCNAWAIAAGPGIVLIDTGMHEPGSLAQLERAMDQVNLRLEQVRLLACTHAHSDHWGQAAPILERAGCELWMHPNHGHATGRVGDPGAALARRLEVGRQSGVPEAALARYAERAKDIPSGVARVIEPDRALLPGVEIETDLGTWSVHETPGHAPSHVCLFQAQRRLLISGDHVLGRISLFYDYGYSSTCSMRVWRCPGTASRSLTFTGTSKAIASSSRSASTRPWRRSRANPGPRSRSRRASTESRSASTTRRGF
jgi:glyoxylase-like metal-dependent hydrolase (beta-lactamase superfamily II)